MLPFPSKDHQVRHLLRKHNILLDKLFLFVLSILIKLYKKKKCISVLYFIEYQYYQSFEHVYIELGGTHHSTKKIKVEYLLQLI